MALIKCPQCGQTVLSVASVCPKCSYLLLEHATPQGDDGGVVACRRCGKQIIATAVDCRFCGYPQQFRRRLRRGLGAVGILALAVIGFLVFRMVAGDGGESDSAVRIGTDSVPVRSPPPAAAEPDSDTAALPVAPTLDVTAAAVPERQPETPATLTRWTVTWANVREDRTTASAVVRILPPGESVAVRDPAGGWWRVYERGVPIGYVAIDLLAARPPEP